MADHIQLHQAWMKKFRNDVDDGAQVYCLNLGDEDFTDGKNTISHYQINSIKIKSLGAKQNYYVEDVENYFCKDWEAIFGLIVKPIIKQIQTNAEVINIEDDNVVFIKKFLAVNAARSPFIQECYNEWANPITDFETKSILPLVVGTGDFQLFKKGTLQFLKNNTNIGFVLPSFCLYLANFIELEAIIPLSSTVAIRIIKAKNNNDERNRQGMVFEINTSDIMKRYNLNALHCEYNTNRSFVIAKSKDDLDKNLFAEIIKAYKSNNHEIQI